MRLIDADKLKESIRSIVYVPACVDCCSKRDIEKVIDEQPTAYDVDKVVERIEERMEHVKGATKYGNKDAKQQEHSYSTVMMYEIANDVEDIIYIVKGGGIDGD